MQYFEKMCGFLRINLKNMRICDMRTSTDKKFASLRLGNEPKNRGFAICGIKKKVFLPTSVIYFRCNSTDVTSSMTAEVVIRKSLNFTKMPARLVFTEHRQKLTGTEQQGHLS